VQARTVLLATGVTNRRPDMPDSVHDAALAQGRLRYCPVCDGFEVTDQRVAVIGTGARGVKEAEFLRSYTRDVTLVASDTGGAIAQWVAIRHPERLARLVLTPCDAFANFLPLALRHLHLLGRTPAGLRVLAEALRLGPVQRLPIAFGRLTVRPIDRGAMAAYTGPLRTSAAVRRDFAALVRAIDARHTLQAAQRLPSFDKPALVAWSLDDRLFPLAHGHRLAALLPQGRLEVIDDAGAFIPEDQPERLAAAIARFVEAT